MKIEITRKELFLELKDSLKLNKDEFFDKLIDFINRKFKIEIDLTKIKSTKLNSMKKQSRQFIYYMNIKYQQYNRHQQRTLENEINWLNSQAFSIEINDSELVELKKLNISHAGPGRPELPWELQSSRGKDRAAKAISDEKSLGLIFHALKKSAKKRRKSLVPVLNRVSSQGAASKLTNFISKAARVAPISLTYETALALIVACNLSQDDYQRIRNVAKAHNADIFPTYQNVLNAKKVCYPENISVSETTAEQPLQNLLDHTSMRLVNSEFVKERILRQAKLIDGDLVTELCLYCKWGFDGATGQSQYKQNFNTTESTDKSLFSTMLVPLDLRSGTLSIWRNPVPSSTRFCRPIKISYEKETNELCQTVLHDVENQIRFLKKSVVRLLISDFKTVEVRVSFDLALTMIDGKVANSISNNSSQQVCNICNASPTQMNKKKIVQELTPKLNTLKHGLSALHAYIRCFECVLHISYRLPIKKWQIRGELDAKKCNNRKKIIQSEFWNKLGLLVDFPKDSGSGSSNDGNTARRAFQNYKLFSEITGVDEFLIWRLYNILCIINSNCTFDVNKFKIYCDETYNLYVNLYAWFYMPVSLHKLLVHSSQIIANFELPIGMYTEEAGEARHKDSKYIREHHTRKMSRTLTITDQFNYLLVTSDPIISSFTFQKTKKKKKAFPKDASEIMTIEDSENQEENLSESDDTDDDMSISDKVRSVSQDIQEIQVNETNEIETLINSETNLINDFKDSDL